MTDTGADPTPANGQYVAGATGFCANEDDGIAYNIGGANYANDCEGED